MVCIGSRVGESEASLYLKIPESLSWDEPHPASNVKRAIAAILKVHLLINIFLYIDPLLYYLIGFFIILEIISDFLYNNS